MKVSPTVNNNVRGPESAPTKKADPTSRSKQSDSAPAPAAPRTEIAGSYNTDISDKAKEMSLARKVAEGTDDVREAKIAELKRRIANKEYNVKSDAIADKMISEHLQTPSS